LPETDARRYFNLMLVNTRRMQRLLDDLLTLSRLESNHNLEDEQVNVPELLRTLESEAASLSHGRHQIKLVLDSAAYLTGSLQEIHSALGNLVSNAVRYTPEGGTIDLSWTEHNGEAVFAVRDSGMGIAPEHIPRLTERFYRVDHSRSRETGGTGLGLAIVKHVLTRHGARLDVQSIPGRGSTFSAIFPGSRVIQLNSSGNVIKFPRPNQAAG
jgi:two-component system phosphate regulon sensor histidine kinase PhoR